MEQSKYPEYCSYCEYYFKTKACLLPYNFIKEFQSIPFEINFTIESVRNHLIYGQSTLNYNTNLFPAFMKTFEHENPNGKTIQKDDSQNHQSIPTSRSNTFSSTFTVVENEPDNKQLSKEKPMSWNTKQMSKTSLSNTESEESDNKFKEQFPLITDEVQDLIDQEKNKSPTYSSKLVEENLTDSKQFVKSTSILPSKEYKAITDEIVSSILLCNTMTTHYPHTKIEMFTTALENESRIIQRSGENYIPTPLTIMNHPSMLAKELASQHSQEDFDLWSNGTNTYSHKSCILNCPSFSILNENQQVEKLNYHLAKHIDSTLIEYSSNEQIKSLIELQIQQKLSSRGHPNTFKWFQIKRKNLSQFLATDQTTLLKRKETHKAPDYQLTSTYKSSKDIDKNYGQKKSPPINEILLDFAEKYVREITDIVIKQNKQFIPNIGTEHSLNHYLFEITKSLILFNKNWMNPNVLTESKHLHKALDYCEFTIPEDQKVDTVTLIVKILKDTREKYKSMFPT